MMYLCLAFGNAKGWQSLSPEDQAACLLEDEKLRERGSVVAALSPRATTLRTTASGDPIVAQEPFLDPLIPFAGFSIVEAESMEEVTELLKNTPCARANGAIEIRPIKV